MSHGPDPLLLGKIIAGRYEIVAPINVGGMGAVYRAVQKSLDRAVAIKFIHPHLLASELTAQRFMAEARALSRINHPHVVSVFDFGRTPEAEGGHLFLVMEHLTGRDLGQVLMGQPLLPLQRVVGIVLQTLEGLAEAHHLGITHRDVKPDNVILEPTRDGRDHVKLIDFGIARVDTGRRLTQVGMVCGTPLYMAPEQASGTAGPSADLYSVGMMLFEMLTGEFPSDPGGRVPPRRCDPRYVAPNRGIPEALAEACVRALEFDPERRFPSAEAFDLAIRDAMVGSSVAEAAQVWQHPSWPYGDRTVVTSGPPSQRARESGRQLADTLPAQVAAPAGPSWGAPSERQPASAGGYPVSGIAPAPGRPVPDGGYRISGIAPAPGRAVAMTASPARSSVFPRDPMLGRAAELAWAHELLGADEVPPAIAFWGRAGVGRTRLAREVAAAAEHDGALVVAVTLDPQPHGELGYRGLRRMILSLSGRTPDELLGEPDADRWTAAGLRLLFSRSQPPGHPATARRGAVSALAWAMARAAARSEHGRVLLVLDDLDRLDGTSLLALQDHLRGDPVPGVTALVTSEHARTVFLPGARERSLRGLSRDDAMRMLLARQAPGALPRSDDDIEPLYVAEVAAALGSDPDLLPDTLEDLLAWHVQALALPQRRLLQTLAIVGTYDVDKLGILLRLPGDTRAALAPLVERAWVQIRGGQVSLRHAVLGRVAAAGAPPSAAVAVHKAVAHELRSSRDLLELHAFHAIHGPADFEAFVLLEEVARLRSARGDNDGAIAALSAAVTAGRLHAMSGEMEAASTALGVFGRKLAQALVVAGRTDEAQGVLEEILATTEPKDAMRAVVLDQLATIAELRGRTDEMERQRRKALQIAEGAGDHKLADRLRAALVAGYARTDTIEDPGIGKTAPPPPTRSERRRHSVLVVEDDSSIREGIQAVLESEEYQAYAAANGREALDVLHRIPKPGLILLDLMMPVMNGWELLEALRTDEEFARIPVVVISAVPGKSKLGASRVLQKPVEVGTLLNLVEEFCD